MKGKKGFQKGKLNPSVYGGVWMKLFALENYCKINNKKVGILTEKELTILTKKQIRRIPRNDIVFFKERHNGLYKMAV